ncbi:MAG: PQQ-binding-like beta-propeller repeat protein [Planctomycetaceae bacterium]|nr:PQQ-binding-like beta-propeller repeat protein [Planctomycetaceae bacterium]
MAKTVAWGLSGSVVLIPVLAVMLGFPLLEAELQRRAETGRRPDHLPESNDGEAVGEPMTLAVSAERSTIRPEQVGVGWPSLLGPTGNCVSPERGLDWSWNQSGPLEKWRIPAGNGYASPVVLGNRLVLFHRVENREVVDCLDAETGDGVWSQAWAATYECPFNHSSGPYSAPVLEAGQVYTIGANGHLACLDLEDGSEIWHRDVHREFQVQLEVWPVSASPVVEGDLLIVNVGGRRTNAGIVAFDKHSGGTAWTATEDGMSCSTPVAATIHANRFLFVWTADALVSLNPEDGQVYWRIPFAAKNYEAAHGTSPLIVDDLVFVSGYQIGNLCLRILPDGSYSELWRDRRDLLDCQYKNLLHVDGHVCGFSATRKSLRCLDLETGAMKWQWRSKITNGSMISVDGHYLVLGENGRLAALDMASHGVEEIAMTARPILRGPILAYPALHNGLLYLRNDRDLLCVDLRPTADYRPVRR